MMPEISVVILTKNEELNLAACLKSLSWCSDLHVVDCGSTDNTLAIAQKLGANCKLHLFESFAQQRNWALENCGLKNEWVLFMDADERSTPEFKDALFCALGKTDDTVAGFYCCWKTYLEGRWLRFSDSFPKWQLRFVRRGKVDFIDFGHGQKEFQPKGKLEYIRAPYLHYPFSKGWTEWWERHNRYSSQEAAARLTEKASLKDIFSRHGSQRNRALRLIASRLPGWPLARFIADYFLKLGFFEGSAGFIYCANMAFYEFLIKIKMRELKSRPKA